MEEWDIVHALSALFPMDETSFQLVALRSRGIVSVRGLAGRRVGGGPGGGPAAIYFKGLAEALDLSIETVTGTPSELVDALIDGSLDALCQGASAPIPEIVDRSMAGGLAITGPENR